MASLRDVLNHIGQQALLEREGRLIARVLAIERGLVGFIEPKAEPSRGDVLRFVQSGRAFRVVNVVPESQQERTDHYRLELLPL